VLAEALVRWQHAAGPFWPYVCAAPFLGTGESGQLTQAAAMSVRPGAGRRSRFSPTQRALADRLLAGVLSPRRVGEGVQRDVVGSFPVVLADLPAAPLVRVAPLLNERGWYVVPVVQRWIASPAVLACRELLAGLLVGAWLVRRPARPRGALLIADGERAGPVGYPPLVPGRTFDNRYEYQICRFPSTRFLEAQSVRRVTWLTPERPAAVLAGGTPPLTLGIPPVARDLHPYREALLLAGIDVDVTLWPPE
jgi:hypothetical protein